ncbi:MAG: VOC family protein [Nakamurella sp.]
MTDSTTAQPKTHISDVGAVFVPVADQNRALGFFVETLGFEKTADFEYGGGLRWVEVAPSGARNTIALVPPGEGATSRTDQTYCAFATSDIEADHNRLRAAGVQVDEVIARTGTARSGLISQTASVPDPVPAQFFFRDVDGNRFLIVQPG